MSATHQLIVYPANRLEDLAVLLEDVLKRAPGHILSPNIVVVESKGMQHWVSMALAQQRGLCMNVQFPMPGTFIWQLVRRMLGSERVPLESPYAREALVWRIDRLLASSAVLDDPRFAAVNRYWQGDAEAAKDDPLKRFQLAVKQADLFEQYLLFRSDWLDAWEANRMPQDLQAKGANETGPVANNAAWQAQLWRLLVKENPDHPLRLQRDAMAAFASQRDKLPPQLCLFSINTLPPNTLRFFDALAQYTQVHLFHLNPCVEYWGDLQSEKQLARQRVEQVERWMAQRDLQQTEGMDADQPESGSGGEAGNPLLANLGGQGKEFFRELQKLDSFEINAFDERDAPPNANPTTTVLQQVQHDILTLRDARPGDPKQKVQPIIDDSITFSSSHSALRELQALHDWLLHRFNDDPGLTPRDVLVMCPQVENYAPYIAAVFDTGYHAEPSANALPAQRPPKLPVSITDRAPRDAEPLISSFLELLQLPDSRFQVSKVLDLLRLPSLQARFGVSAAELATLEWWLSEACIHWGLDERHKAQAMGGQQTSDMFSWDWGLRRLLRGFARSDQEELVNGDLLLPHVEGDNALLLGRLMQVLERLRRHAQLLAKPRPPGQWGDYLRELRDAFFAYNADEEERDAGDTLDKAIDQLLLWTDKAGYSAELPLEVARFYLSRSLGMPDTSNRFMTGQVTFCSLEPMRSAPFRIIAILGLNDGEYPRPQVAFGFDLMAATGHKPGDRSRRGDDRYLFLEALICARESLYLSFQGADITKNSERQPSLILTELMDYLARGYGWKFSRKDEGIQLHCQPLHPFSPANFSPDAKPRSFDSRWLEQAKPCPERNNRIELPAPESMTDADGLETLKLEDLVRFFENPARAFAEQRLGLHLERDDQLLDDAEPFDANKLEAHKGRDRLLSDKLEEQPLETTRNSLLKGGHLPDSLHGTQQVDTWQQEAELLAKAVRNAGGLQLTLHPFELVIDTVRLVGELPLVRSGEGQQLLRWRAAKTQAKDGMRLWLYHLCAQVDVRDFDSSLGLFLNKDSNGLDRLKMNRVDDPRRHLDKLIESWRNGQLAPQLLNSDLGWALSRARYEYDRKLEAYKLRADSSMAESNVWSKKWEDDPHSNSHGVGQDLYERWFWPEAPELKTWREALMELYAPPMDAVMEAKS